MLRFPKLARRIRKIRRFRRWAVIGAIGVISLVGPVAWLLLRNAPKTEAAWFDGNWGYRQKIPLTNTSGSTQTDFQVMATVDTATLITAGKMLSSCADVRVTNIGGKKLSYWIEPNTCNTASTKIWVKADNIYSASSGNTTDVYLYYGNPLASTESSTEKTFIRDIASAAAAWPLDDTTTTQSYSRVVNATASAGRNVALNGTFDADANWTKGSGWTISGGTAVATNVNVGVTMTQTIPVTSGKAYSITYTVSGYSGGSVLVSIGATGTSRSANGTYTQTLVATSTTLAFSANSNGTTLNIDDVTVTQVNIPASDAIPVQILTDGNMETAGTAAWTANNNATLTKQTTSPHGGSQVLRIARSTTNSPQATQNAALVTGTPYRITGYARSDGTSLPQISISGAAAFAFQGTTSTAWQPFDVVVIGTGTNLTMQSNASSGTSYVEFDDVVVSLDTGIRSGELAQDQGFETWTNATTLTNWTKSTSGTSSVNQETTTIHGGSNAVRLDVDGSNSVVFFYQNAVAIGKTYTVTYWARASAASGVSMQLSDDQGGGLGSVQALTNVYTQYSATIVAARTGIGFKRNTATSASIYIDDVTITEVSPLVGLPTNGVTLGSTSNGHLTNAYTFDGSNDTVNIYSTDLNSVFSPTEGSVSIWVKVSGSGVWSDGSARRFFNLLSDANNFIYMRRTTTNGQVEVVYDAGGTIKTFTVSSLSSTSWMHFVLTWNKTADQAALYLNGVQQGSTLTGLGTWTGNLSSTAVAIGAQTSTGTNVWSGMINDVKLYTRALSPDEVRDMYSGGTVDIQTYTTSNYLGRELFRKYNASVAVGSAASEEKAPGPVGYWNFDEGTGTSAKDTSPNSNTGTLTNGPVWNTEDKCITGKCVFLDGSNDFVSIGSNKSAYKFGTGSFTLSGWVKYQGTSGGTNTAPAIFGVSASGTSSRFSIDAHDGGSIGIFAVDNSGNVLDTTPGGNVLADNNWHYVTLVFNRTNNLATSYIDGRQLGQSSMTTLTGAISPQGTAQIGSQVHGSASTLKGYVDDIKVYNYARSVAQIKSDYLAGAGKAGSGAQVGNAGQEYLSEGLTTYWKLDESSWTNDCSTATVTDSSGNANTGKSCDASVGPTGGVSGKFNKGGTFDGTDDYLLSNSSTLINMSAGTVSIWFKPSGTQSNSQPYIFSHNIGTGIGGRVYLTTNSTGTTAVFTLGAGTTCGSTSIVADTWHHAVVTWDGTNCASYVDGSTVTQTTFGGIGSQTSIKLGYQGSAAVSASGFTGSIDELRIYNRALSREEARSLYNWAPGPVGYWNFDEASWTNNCSTDTMFDISGNGLHGKSCGNGSGLTTPGTGKYGNGVDLDGSDDYVSIADNDAIDFPASQDFSVSTWVKIPSTNQPNTGTASNALIEKWTGSGGYPYVIRYNNHTGANNGKITIGRYDGTNNPAAISTITINDDTYHHLTFTKSGPLLSLYIDGKVNVTTTDTTTGTTTNSSVLGVGVRPAGTPTFYMKGVVDELKIYNYARTPRQIIEDMNGGHPIGGSPVGSPIAWWKFDEQQGQTVRDSIPNGNNGTLGASTSSSTDDPTWTTGSNCKVGGCLQFDGGDFVTIGNIAAYKVATKSATFWAKPTTSISSTIAVTSFQSANWYAGFAATNRMITSHSSAAGSQVTASTPNSTVPTNEWHHYGYTWEQIGGTVYMKYYKDGKLIQTSSNTGGYSSTYGSSFILGSFATSSAWFTGYLDEIKLYNAALTEDQMRLDYNAGAALNFGTGTASESATLADGPGNDPVAYWNFDEHAGTSALDTSGNNNTGTLTNGPIWTTGKIGSGIKFDGTDDYVNAGSSTSLEPTQITLESWIKTTETGTQTTSSTIIDKTRGSTLGSAYLLNVGGRVLGGNAGKVEFATYNGSVWTTSYSTSTVNDGNWHHVVATYDGSNIKTYIDGQLDKTTAATVSFGYNGTQSLFIGRYNSAGDASFDGSIDDLKIYNYARTASQIAYDYNRGRPVAHWKFDECQGGTLNDATGNQLTGTWSGTSGGSQTAVGTCNTASTAWGNGATGKFNSSLNFDGTDDFVSFTRNTQFRSAATQGTISAWVKYNVLDLNFRTALDVSGTGVTGLILFTTSTVSARPQFQYGDGAAVVSLRGTSTLSTGTWYHVVGTWDSTGGKLYINGKLEASSATAPSITIGSGTSWIGANSGTQRFHDGSLDDVRVYNYALSATQVKQIMNEGAGVRFGPSTGSP